MCVSVNPALVLVNHQRKWARFVFLRLNLCFCGVSIIKNSFYFIMIDYINVERMNIELLCSIHVHASVHVMINDLAVGPKF